MKKFKEKVAIITGGASGIGLKLAEALSKKGTQVILGDLQKGKVEEAAGNIRKSGGHAEGEVLDVTDAEAVQNLVNDVVRKYGKLDFMFNNAGVAIMGKTQHLSLDDWKKTIDVNLNGVVYGVHAAYPVMIEQGFGHIVNIASLAGLLPTPGAVPYGATKHAVVGLSVSLRGEAAQYGVNVNVACPSFVQTPFLDNAKRIKVSEKKAWKHFNSMGKPIPPEECAKQILEGVAKNKGIITVPFIADAFWRMYRFSPEGVSKIAKVTEKVFAQ